MLVVDDFNKGKTAMDNVVRRDYGSATQTVRGRGAGIQDYRAASSSGSGSGSRSGERLRSVPEDDVDSLAGDGGDPSAWNVCEDGDNDNVDADGGETEGDWEYSQHEYRRAVRLYAIVPLGSFIFLLFALFIPKLIASSPRPNAPSTSHLLLSALLSSALWCLAHVLRVPIHTLLHSSLTGLATLPFGRRQQLSPKTYAYITVATSILHAIAIAALQELLRLASFAILDLHWSPPGPGPRAQDAAFREVWALAMGWALAEVCAGVVQGYEQLSLYAPPSPAMSSDRVPSPNGKKKDGFEEGRVFDEEAQAVGLVRRSMSRAEEEDEARMLTQGDIGEALEELSDVRAREELEELYGEAYIDIPVFVALLQRLDSLLLSLGITLLLGAAYLPNPSAPLSLFSSPSPPPSILLTLTQRRPHTLPLPTTLLILILLHAFLGALHAPPALARVGLPAAAYASCVVGLALCFAGVGVWVGVW